MRRRPRVAGIRPRYMIPPHQGQVRAGKTLSAVLAASIVAALTGFTSCGRPERSTGYQCTVSARHLETQAMSTYQGLQIVALASRSSDVLVDPATGRRVYAATLGYGLGGGPENAIHLGLRTQGWLGQFAPALSAHVTDSARLEFVYDRARRQDAERILRQYAPSRDWNKLIVTLANEVAGSATAGIPDVIGVAAEGKEDGRAYLTMYSGGGFSISREWSASVTASAPGWVHDRLGAPANWDGRIATGYEVRFGRHGQVQQLVTVAELAYGGTLHQTTRLLDLTGSTNRSAAQDAQVPALTSLFAGVSAGRIFFASRSKTLWQRMAQAATTVTATYAVTDNDLDVELEIGPYGAGFSQSKSSTKLQTMQIKHAHGRLELTCAGSPDLPRAPHRTGKPLTHLPPTRIPPAQLPPTPSTPTPTPTNTPTPTPTPTTEPTRTTEPTAAKTELFSSPLRVPRASGRRPRAFRLAG